MIIHDTSLNSLLTESKHFQVYRGVRNSDGLEIVAKILHENLSEDTPEAQRFVSGCEIHRQLNHPNIVTLYDHGVVDGRCYSVEAYLPGGDLRHRLRVGLSLQAVLKIVKDIARAIDHMATHDVVHGDIKAENILFNSAGQAVLTDFNIARIVNQASAGKRQRVALGTAAYMAPEQAAGNATDSRADLYSLGVLLFEILTGAPPYVAEEEVEVGLKHLQDPIPRLPSHLDALQSVIDRALAKRREHRFQSGQEFVEALDEVRHLADLPPLTVRSMAVNTGEIRALERGSLLSTPRDPSRQERHQARHQRRRTRLVVLSTLLFAAIGVALYVNLDNELVDTGRLLSTLGLTEDPLVNTAWNEARSLHEDPNQGLATIVAAYRRVLAIAPDHEQAQAMLASLVSDWKEEVRAALDEGNLELATTRLTEARDIFPGDREWDSFQIVLADRERAERILASTQALLQSHGLSDLPSATAAIQAYQEVLRLAPEHSVASAALTELGQHYAGLATTAINQGELNRGIGYLERATAADATIPALDDVRKLISQATTAQAAIEELLQQARRLRSQNRLMDPPGENAVELYQRVLATDPNNVIASQGLDEITAQIAATVEQRLGEGLLDEANTLVVQARAAGLPEAGVDEIDRRVAAEKLREATIGENLANARELIATGFLTAPAEENAVAKLREVQRLDPGNLDAVLLLKECAERLAEVAMEADSFALREEAKTYLDLALAITPDVEAWVNLRESWEGADIEGEATEGPTESTGG